MNLLKQLKTYFTTPQVQIKLLYPDALMPKKAHQSDACYDLHIHSLWNMTITGMDEVLPMKIDGKQVWLAHQGYSYLAKVGFSMALPEGFEAQIRPRSGLALKNGLALTNSPGTIDEDYRNEVGVIMHLVFASSLQIAKGDRIAQMAIKRVPKVDLVEVNELNNTKRGQGGFGSTGV